MSALVINESVEQNHNIQIVYSSFYFINWVGRSTELFLLVFCVCLMNYLIVRIKEIKSHHITSNPRQFFIITSLISSFIICTSLIRKLRIVSLLTFSFFSIIYFCIFVNTSNKFKRTLLQRALERLTQHGCNKEEMKQYRYFKYTINVVCCGLLFILIGENLIHIPSIYMGVLFNQSCYFPFNLFPHFIQVELSNEITEILFKVSEYIIISNMVLNFIGLFLSLAPFILVTILIWINLLTKYIRGTPKIKYTTVPSTLVTPLLIA